MAKGMRDRKCWSGGLILFLVVFFSLAAAGLEAQRAEQVAPLIEKFTWRALGPAVMGGRTVDIEAVERQPWIIYAAVGPSGLWKSENGGVSWAPVFFRETTVSVGDLAISPSHPEIIWVGTGEATCRNSVTIGDGVYKSEDGGRTWKNMGLAETRHISRIVINPGDPNIVYVAAMGHLWGPNPERGVFKTMDGGETWSRVLYINENTGVADLAMDLENPLLLYAAAYEHRRLPYLFSSGGPGSGLYRTTDGGRTWKKLEKGLPAGVVGRIGLAVSRSRPGVVYALVEHEDGGLFRSEDRGETWQRMGDRETYRRINTRPFYYSRLWVDPTDDRVIYVLSTGAHFSTDGGRTFRAFAQGTHPDHHALWINPANPRHLILGNDGGIDISYDGGRSWHSVQNIDAAEVYSIGYDMRKPYYVYCGLQDNGTWGGPSQTWDAAGIANDDWFMVGGGDGMYVQVPPDDPLTVYSNFQMNNLYRYDLRISRSKTIRPLAPLKEPPYRFNWLTPIHISPHDPKTIYVGSQYLLRSTDRGQSWQRISPDLTTNDPRKLVDSGGPISKENTGAESHCTITTTSESSVAPGVIWCGTDDGLVWVTRDGGRSWTNVTRNIPGLPAGTWCSRVEASHFEAGTAYASFDGHRNDDYGTYVFKTSDYGKTWKSLRANLPFGWVNVVREDPKNPRLLYVGTEFGIFASLDGGESWFSLKNNLPTVAVHDIAVHPRDGDLIVGTHGRGIWILDDIRFLQEMTPEVLTKGAHLFSLRPAVAYYASTRRESFTPPVFAAKNPPYGLAVTLYIKERPKEKPRVTVMDAQGKVVTELSLLAQAGLQREYWNLQYIPENREGKRLPPPPVVAMALPLTPPGEYTVEVDVDGQKYRQKAVIEPDPRIAYDREADQARLDLMAEILTFSRRLGLAITGVRQVRRDFDDLKRQLSQAEKQPEKGQDETQTGKERYKERSVQNVAMDMKKEGGDERQGQKIQEELRKGMESFEQKLRALEAELIPPPIGSYAISREMALRGGTLPSLIMNLASSITSYPGSPTKTDGEQTAELRQAVDELVGRLNEFIGAEIPSLNALLLPFKLKPLKSPEQIK